MKVRPIRIEGDVAYVPLTRGYEAVIDAADVHLVEGYNWHACVKPNNVYAQRIPRVDGKKTQVVKMHRVITSATTGQQVDHRDRNGLDNRRQNLRLCSHSENQWNQGLHKSSKSGFKGVTWSNSNNKWLARIRFHGERRNLGFYDTPEEAHKAYCEAGKALHGEYFNNGV